MRTSRTHRLLTPKFPTINALGAITLFLMAPVQASAQNQFDQNPSVASSGLFAEKLAQLGALEADVTRGDAPVQLAQFRRGGHHRGRGFEHRRRRDRSGRSSGAPSAIPGPGIQPFSFPPSTNITSARSLPQLGEFQQFPEEPVEVNDAVPTVEQAQPTNDHVVKEETKVAGAPSLKDEPPTIEHDVPERKSLKDEPNSPVAAPSEKRETTVKVPNENSYYPEHRGDDYVYEDDYYGYHYQPYVDYGYHYQPYVDLDDYSSYHWSPSAYYTW